MTNKTHPAEFLGAPALPVETKWRHQHWAETRAKVLAAMRAVNTAERNVDRFVNCGAQAAVKYSPSLQKHKIFADFCHSRHCQPCARSKANTITGNLRRRLAQKAAGRYRFVTLTLAHTQADRLADLIKQLYQSFRRLRAREIWKKTQVGGAMLLEVKYNATGWHPHLHVIAEGKFIDVHELADQWHEVTGSSFVVDVRALRSADETAAYVAKYVTKGTSDSVWAEPDLAQEWILASKGVRVCATLGTWRGFKLLQRTARTEDWKHVGMLHHIIAEAARGEPWAQAITLSLRPTKPSARRAHDVVTLPALA